MMKDKNTIGMLAGCAVTIIGIIGLIWKVVESTIYRFQNPDFTDMRIFMENPQLTIWSVVFTVMILGGAEVAQHYANHRRN